MTTNGWALFLVVSFGCDTFLDLPDIAMKVFQRLADTLKGPPELFNGALYSQNEGQMLFKEGVELRSHPFQNLPHAICECDKKNNGDAEGLDVADNFVVAHATSVHNWLW